MEAQESRHQFKEGDLALLIDRKDRRYMITLDATKAFHTHAGLLQHAAIIGQEHGARLTTTLGQTLLVLPPSLEDYVTHLPRATQVIYPKDLGAILVYGDIFPGARVLEAGLGSGGLTVALLRAVGPTGAVFSYDVREDVIARARRNIETVFPRPDNLTIHLCDVYQEVREQALDRVILDLPEPWQAVPQVAQALVPGGHPPLFPPHGPPGVRAGDGPPAAPQLRPGGDPRGDRPPVARGPPQRAPGAPHGGAHGVHRDGEEVRTQGGWRLTPSGCPVPLRGQR